MAAEHETRSLAEVHGTVQVPKTGSWIRRMFAFAGPAYLVSVGYMDPGNWATDLAGGARFGYQLVWVLLMSNLMAVLLQTLAARFGVVTGKDLAQACRDYYPQPLVFPLWIVCEIAIVACDLAEVLGAAIGLNLLFGIPPLWGVMITALDVLLLLGLSRLGMRRMEAFIIVLIATMGGCFAIEMFLSRPDVPAILANFIPRGDDGRPSLFALRPGGGISVLGLHGDSLYIAMGILGATVMPHNLYLHSALVQTRAVAASPKARRQACNLNLVDSAVALNAAFFVNAAILILAAAVFHNTSYENVASLEDAHALLAPLLGTSLASTLFAVALLCSGQSSTITGTLAGQIVMEGFLRVRIRPWLRRLISRGLAIIPAVLVIAIQGPGAVGNLLVLSQVVLSLQLAFAVVPLVAFTCDRRKMGEFVNPAWVTLLAVITTTIIIALNGKLVVDAVHGWLVAAGDRAFWLGLLILPPIAALAGLLLYITGAPLLEGLAPILVRRGPAAPAAPASAGATSAPPVQPRAETTHRRIGVALEFGPADPSVLEHVRAMPLAADAELFLFHVVESAAGRYLGPETSDVETREESAALEDIAEGFRERGVRATAALGHGDAKAELARLVEEHHVDLLIAGAHGHRMIQDLLYGSTTSGLRHRIKCPLVIVPMPAER